MHLLCITFNLQHVIQEMIIRNISVKSNQCGGMLWYTKVNFPFLQNKDAEKLSENKQTTTTALCLYFVTRIKNIYIMKVKSGW